MEVLRGFDVTWIVEKKPLGTAGAIVNALEYNSDIIDFLVVNADTWINASIKNLVQISGNGLGVVEVADCGRYGTVSFEENGIVSKFIEKRKHSGKWVD